MKKKEKEKERRKRRYKRPRLLIKIIKNMFTYEGLIKKNFFSNLKPQLKE